MPSSWHSGHASSSLPRPGLRERLVAPPSRPIPAFPSRKSCDGSRGRDGTKGGVKIPSREHRGGDDVCVDESAWIGLHDDDHIDEREEDCLVSGGAAGPQILGVVRVRLTAVGAPASVHRLVVVR